MASLRLILLLAGVLFIAALAWRETRRGRQDAATEHARSRRAEPRLEPELVPATDVAASPVNPETSPDNATAATATLPQRRRTDLALPIVALRDAQFAARDSALAPDAPAPATAGTTTTVADPDPTLTMEPAARSVAAPSIADWPPEEIRRICSLRLVPKRQERFAGRELRQGLLGLGFQHGELGIYHLAGGEDRAMLSVANLSMPGQLDPSLMDFQRFAGLHLFAVLPTRIPNRLALQQLFAVALELAERLHGGVLDVSGRPLDSARMQELQLQFAAAESPPAAAE
jgi:cell division protein ZipA